MNYYDKYIEYKQKYIHLKNKNFSQIGGSPLYDKFKTIIDQGDYEILLITIASSCQYNCWYQKYPRILEETNKKKLIIVIDPGLKQAEIISQFWNSLPGTYMPVPDINNMQPDGYPTQQPIQFKWEEDEKILRVPVLYDNIPDVDEKGEPVPTSEKYNFDMYLLKQEYTEDGSDLYQLIDYFIKSSPKRLAMMINMNLYPFFTDTIPNTDKLISEHPNKFLFLQGHSNEAVINDTLNYTMGSYYPDTDIYALTNDDYLMLRNQQKYNIYYLHNANKNIIIDPDMNTWKIIDL